MSSLLGILGRFVFALILVYATYNPEGISYYHWAIADLHLAGFSFSELPPFNPLKVFCGVVLLIGWITFVVATRRSLGIIGVALAVAFFGSLAWVLTDQGVLSVTSLKVLHHIVLVIISAVLTVGMAWSLITRRLSGQVDIDQVDN